MRISRLFALFVCPLLVLQCALADDGAGGAGNIADSRPADTLTDEQAQELLELGEAFRSGFFELCWSSIFEIYDAAIRSASGFSTGSLPQSEAQDSLTTPGLLLSTVYTSLERIEQLCPEEDTRTRAELAAIQPLLQAEDELLTALLDWFSRPAAATESAALQAKQRLELEIARHAPPDTATGGQRVQP